MTKTSHQSSRRISWFAVSEYTNNRVARGIVWVVVILLASNQYIISSMMPTRAAASPIAMLRSLFATKSSAANTIIAPQLNADGATTSLVEQPTISPVPANPNTGDALADAKTVMLGTGAPLYAPDGISFNDPITAEKQWAVYETSIQLTGTPLDRYNRLTHALPCNYCCGDPKKVTHNQNCGCAHAKAARGFFRYMIQTYGDRYSDEQLLGEAFRWQAIWYPRGAVEDYLLATGNGNLIGHKTHGGAGADGMHGLTK